MLHVSQAPLEKLQPYKRRMGWNMPWVPSARTDFNFDLGYSSSEEQTREWVAPMLEALPPIADRNASQSGTDVVGYLTQSQGLSSFVLDNGAVYHTYSTGARGVEFLMGYYEILDRAPKGCDEGDAFRCGSAGTTSTELTAGDIEHDLAALPVRGDPLERLLRALEGEGRVDRRDQLARVGEPRELDQLLVVGL
jgi:Bacterial protein of unknown function (DUF899)